MSAKKLKPNLPEKMPSSDLKSIDPLKLLITNKRSRLIKGRDAIRECASCHKISLSSVKVCSHCGSKF
jgi:hypothetical protein